ncbi:hypothetical protein CHS0354_000352 [Potamilus streckersoni]|uniref:Uncharacterized protein n=1 Tax=Potamilus streckersoni TaxID=2493646 RepID=A0AAE0W8V3_9BIVA|nr:hypothetical protein CHS0354_000352 [Potamilus streckersoni]
MCKMMVGEEKNLEGRGEELLVTYIPNPYSYCQFPILASRIPMTNSNCTEFTSSVYFLDACAFYDSDVILFYEQITGTIYKEGNHSHADQKTWTRIHAGPTSFLTTITFDWLSKSLYWTDPLYGWIGVISIMDDDVGMYRILIDENIQRPHGITLDPFQGILFWTDISQTVKIERSNMSGDNRMILISFGLITPYSIVADVLAERIFWIDDGRDTIESAQYDGTGRKLIRRIVHAVLFDIEVFKV